MFVRVTWEGGGEGRGGEGGMGGLLADTNHYYCFILLIVSDPEGPGCVTGCVPLRLLYKRQ